MAILEDLGLEVKILVNNSPLKEYEDKEAGPTDDGFGEEIRKCRRYVEVVEDAEFAVQLHVTPANNYLNDANKRISFVLDLDGQENFEEALLNRKRTQHLVEGKDEANGEKTVRRNFRFTAVATVDDDNTERVNKEKKTARQLGLLRVRVWRCKLSESNESDTEDSDSDTPISAFYTAGLKEVETHLTEKALKGKPLSHRATLSAAVPIEDPSFESLDYLDPVETPLAIFYFKYRSKAVLQEELIIPRSREPSPQPVDLDGLPFREVLRLARENVEILPLHEIRRLAQLRLLSSREGGNIPEVAVKREPGRDQTSQRQRKFVKMGDGREAVDLTGDD